MDYKNLFEKFNEGGKLLLKDATVTFDAIPWSKHPTFEGVELPYETGVISIYGHYYYNIPQPTAAIKPKSKKNHPIRRCTCYNAHIRYLVPNPSGTKFPCKHSYERMIL